MGLSNTVPVTVMFGAQTAEPLYFRRRTELRGPLSDRGAGAFFLGHNTGYSQRGIRDLSGCYAHHRYLAIRPGGSADSGGFNQLLALGPKPIENLTPEEARRQPAVPDAVKALLQQGGRSTDPEPVGKVEDRMIPGAAGQILARIYTPQGAGPFPVIVYFHGGGS